MKGFYAFMAVAVVVLLSVLSSAGYNYYLDRNCEPTYDEDNSVEVQIEETVAQLINPSMCSVDEVYKVYRDRIAQMRCDSIFVSIPSHVIVNVASVVIGRNASATQQDIVDEYEKNYDSVYKFLSTNPNSEKIIVSDQFKALDTDGKVKLKDTVIDGKVYKKEVQNE